MDCSDRRNWYDKKIMILDGCGGIGSILTPHASIEGYDAYVVILTESIEANPLKVPSIAANAISTTDLERSADALPEAISGFVSLFGFMDENCSALEAELASWEEIITGSLTMSYDVAGAFCPVGKGSAIIMTGYSLEHFDRPAYGPSANSKAKIAALTRQSTLEFEPNVRAKRRSFFCS